jgi:hypothetical protein
VFIGVAVGAQDFKVFRLVGAPQLLGNLMVDFKNFYML